MTRLNRRDILKFGAGVAAGVAGTEVVRRMPKTEDLRYDEGTPQQISYERITGITYFQSNRRIEAALEANRKQIIFETETGHLRIRDGGNNELESYTPLEGEVKNVQVSIDGPTMSFEYARHDGTTFGARVWRNIEDGKLNTSRWDTGFAGKFDTNLDLK